MFLIWFFAPAKRAPTALAFGEKVRARCQRLERAFDRRAMAAGISRPSVVAGGAWCDFVIADLARGYRASLEHDDGVLLRNAIGEAFGSVR